MKIKTPNGGDEVIDPKSINVLRETTEYEREDLPSAVSVLTGSSYKFFSVELINGLIDRLDDLKLARLTAPSGHSLFVNASRVTDRDPASTIFDDKRTKSVLNFGPGANAPRIRVRETEAELMVIWKRLGLDLTPFNTDNTP